MVDDCFVFVVVVFLVCLFVCLFFVCFFFFPLEVPPVEKKIHKVIIQTVSASSLAPRAGAYYTAWRLIMT